MCGIGGIAKFDKNARVDIDDLRGINHLLSHRGPDFQDFIIHKSVGICHTRLSIVDLGQAANQPFESADGKVFLVFNGEIYNYKELRLRLQDSQFATKSDTEVVLNGYLKWGLDHLLKEIDGMFAMAIYDSRSGQLHLVRDRFGKKPLYYSLQKDSIIFASEIQALKKHVNKTLNLQSLDYFLSELCIPQPETIWNEIRQLPSGHSMTIDLNNQKTSLMQFWKANFTEEPITELEAIETCEELLTRAIEKRLMGDVPIGTFLSGGLDSGLITSILARKLRKDITAFTVKFNDPSLDESRVAGEVAQQMGINHEILDVSYNLSDHLTKIISSFDEPFADPSIVPSYFISQAISSNTKVALSGDGGDEIFAGYFNYQLAHQADTLRSDFLQPLQISYSKIISRFTRKPNLGQASEFLIQPAYEQLGRKMGFSQKDKINLYEGGIGNEDGHFRDITERILNKSNSCTMLKTVMNASLKTRLQNGYLVKVDRTSMAHSLEVRSPFLDLDLFNFASRIPGSILLKNHQSKYILRKLASKHIGDNYSKLPKKGFGVPLKHWLSNDLMEITSDLFNSSDFLEGLPIKKEYCKEIIHDHYKGLTDHSNKIWLLLVLELWRRNQ